MPAVKATPRSTDRANVEIQVDFSGTRVRCFTPRWAQHLECNWGPVGLGAAIRIVWVPRRDDRRFHPRAKAMRLAARLRRNGYANVKVERRRKES